MFEIFLIFSLFIIFVIIKFTYHSWASPVALYTYWSAVLIIGGFWAYPEYIWGGYGLPWWIGSCFCFLFGSILVGNTKRTVIKFSFPNIFPKMNFKQLLWAYFIIGIMYSVLMLANNGFSISSIRSMTDIFEINNYMQGHRYGHEDLHESPIQQICLSFTYGLPICVGYMLAKYSFSEIKYYCYVCFLPNLLVTSLNNTKCGVIFAAMLFITGYLISYIESNKQPPKLSGSFIKYAGGGLMLFLTIMILAIRLRYNSDESRASFDIIAQIFKDYLFGGTLNFDYYFDKFYDERVQFNYLPDSNIVTANYYWINKYTYIGALLIWIIRGVFCGILFNKLKSGLCYPLELSILAYFFLNAMYFFIWVPFSYTTVTIGVFLLFPFFISKYRINLTTK